MALEDRSGSRFERVSFKDATFYRIDFTGTQIRGAYLHGVRMRAVEPVDVRIDGGLENVEPAGVRLSAGREFPLAECLRIVVNEHWEHRLFAERDLSLLEKEN